VKRELFLVDRGIAGVPPMSWVMPSMSGMRKDPVECTVVFFCTDLKRDGSLGSGFDPSRVEPDSMRAPLVAAGCCTRVKRVFLEGIVRVPMVSSTVWSSFVFRASARLGCLLPPRLVVRLTLSLALATSDAFRTVASRLNVPSLLRTFASRVLKGGVPVISYCWSLPKVKTPSSLSASSFAVRLAPRPTSMLMSALPSVLSRLNVELRASFCGSKLDAVWYSLLKRGELAIFGNGLAQQYTPEGMLELELLCCSRRVVAVRKTESKEENEWAAVSSVDRV
jgi:hypothetical protein